MVPHHLSIIVPFHRNLSQLKDCLEALGHRGPDDELIVVGDEAEVGFEDLAGAHGARTVTIRGPVGPAAARNLGAAHAVNPILVFVDSDVVPAHDALARIRASFDRSTLGAVFGSYDEAPRDPGLLSQYRNLSHAFFHQRKRGPARTFWAGLGAVRADAFHTVGGFDARFRRPSVEDIDLGYRLSAAGVGIVLDPTIRGCHLKRWTLRSAVVTDVRDRGVPWMQLMLRRGGLDNDLNTANDQRLSLALSYALVATAGAGIAGTVSLGWTAALLGTFLAVNVPYYRYFIERRGVWFAMRIVPAHLIHHLGNGVAAIVGFCLHHANRVSPPGRPPGGTGQRDSASRRASTDRATVT